LTLKTNLSGLQPDIPRLAEPTRFAADKVSKDLSLEVSESPTEIGKNSTNSALFI
jgi:hypothetical protein